MANSKITSLPAATVAATTNEIPANEGDIASKKVTVLQFRDLISLFGQRAYLTAQHSISSTTGTEITGLRVTLPGAGTYVFRYKLICQSAATTTGHGFALNYTGSTTKMSARLTLGAASAAATTGIMSANAALATAASFEGWATKTLATTAANMIFAGVANAAANGLVEIFGIIVVTNGGDLALWHASEVAAAACSVEVGSSALVQKVA